MLELSHAQTEVTSQIAFSLLSDAYADLARTLIEIEEEAARQLLQNVQQRAALHCSQVQEADTDSAIRTQILSAAADQVQAVLSEVLQPIEFEPEPLAA
ncbi:hypothetical protein [Methylobacterium durans]|uniref:Uncharacterized protein n=1 Tax=Methylobacterium durans TaxID=2202825 RepID=A0A2U8W3N6_9HYPH|nr:hypothetical protein [Methylobacterium durans]AWN39972.1 hypothetical protein DK389_04710 [Methylobacterium durans]